MNKNSKKTSSQAIQPPTFKQKAWAFVGFYFGLGWAYNLIIDLITFTKPDTFTAVLFITGVIIALNTYISAKSWMTFKMFTWYNIAILIFNTVIIVAITQII